MFPGEISVKKHVFVRSELCFLGNEPLETLNPKRLMSVYFFLLYEILLTCIPYCRVNYASVSINRTACSKS